MLIRDKWVPVTTAWCVLRLRMEERPPIWRVAANIINKQAAEDNRQGVVLQIGGKNIPCYEMFTQNYSDLD